MSAFTIRDIENMCGIKAHTLRIWEQRYQLIRPRRKAGNHRLYDNEDLKYLLRIAFLYHHGYKISELARLNEEEISRITLEIPQPGSADEIFINQLVEASLDFDQEAFAKVMNLVILHMGFEKAIIQVVYPFLNKIGILWLTGNVVPAQEHFASAIIVRKLVTAINGLETVPAPGPGAAIFLLYTPEKEFHELPLLFMHYLLKKNGKAVVYFGTNTSLEELASYCENRPVTHLCFYLVTNLLHCEPNQYLQKLQQVFPGKQIVFFPGAPLVLSGSQAQPPPHLPGVRILRSGTDIEVFVREKQDHFLGNT
jgi:DNA-binding transcriptional MerR regulator